MKDLTYTTLQHLSHNTWRFYLIKKIHRWREAITAYKARKGFTLIELIVVMAIIAILVLLAAPRFLGRTEDAMTNRIKNDIRVAETKLDEYLVRHENLDDWESTVPTSDLEDHHANGSLYDRTGLMDSEDSIHDGDYSRLPTDFIRDMVQSALDGAFYSNEEGNVYYHADRGSQGSGGNNEAPDASDNPFAVIPGVSEDYDPTTDWNAVPDGSDGAYPEWTEQELFAYVIEDNDTATITGYYGANPGNDTRIELDMVIPEYITEGDVDYKVTTVSGLGYHDRDLMLSWEYSEEQMADKVSIQLESVHIPNTVEVIETFAFGNPLWRWSSLEPDAPRTAIYVGKNVKHIDEDAFSFGRYEIISVPANIEHLSTYAFSDIDAETVIVQSLGTTPSDYYLSDANLATSLFIEAEVNTIILMDGVHMLSDEMFYGAQVNKLIVPDTITHIGMHALSSSSITEFKMPNSVTYIAPEAFEYTNIGGEIIFPESLTTISENIFYKFSDNIPLTHIEFRGAITEIGSEAFSGNALTEIVFPGTLTSIGARAFERNNLEHIYIPDSVESIGTGAFASNPLQTVSIPAHTTIGNNAFPESAEITVRD